MVYGLRLHNKRNNLRSTGLPAFRTLKCRDINGTTDWPSLFLVFAPLCNRHLKQRFLAANMTVVMAKHLGVFFLGGEVGVDDV